MTATAEAYGFGARAPYAQMRESEYDMKERVRLSGLFPRVRNEPMTNQLRALLKEFENNAALTGILERRRRLENRLQFELQGSEGMDALNRNLAPPFRAGLAGAATSAAVAETLRLNRVERQKAVAQRVEDAVRRKRAADILAAQQNAGNNQPGEIPVDDELGLSAVGSQVPGTPARMPGTPARMPGTPTRMPGTPGGRLPARRNTNRSRSGAPSRGRSRGSQGTDE